MDNDCDGTVDESAGSAWYQDADGDGYGGTTSSFSCTAPTGYVSTTGDCDDGDAAVNPAASEVADGVDNDCDGSVDEGTGSYTVCATGGTYTTIQRAVDFAADGDIITICPGTYDPVEISGLDITLQGADPDTTQISNPDWWSITLTIADSTVALRDIMVSAPGCYSSTSTFGTGGMYVTNSNLTMSNARVHDVTCSGPAAYYGVSIEDSTVDISDCSFDGNASTATLRLVDSRGTVQNTVFADNTAQTYSVSGTTLDYFGDIVSIQEGYIEFSNNLFYGNHPAGAYATLAVSAGTDLAWITNNVLMAGAVGAHGIAIAGDGADIENNILYCDSSIGCFQYGIQVHSGTPTVEYNDSLSSASPWGSPYADYDGMTFSSTNLSEDPDFAAWTSDDFTLLSGSPCIDAGNPSTDFNDPDGTRNDMGAFGGPYGDWDPSTVP